MMVRMKAWERQHFAEGIIKYRGSEPFREAEGAEGWPNMGCYLFMFSVCLTLALK